MSNIKEIVTPPAGELKPCPFCGAPAVYAQYEHKAGLRWKVMCCGCLAEIDPGYAQTKHAVANMWNRRHMA